MSHEQPGAWPLEHQEVVEWIASVTWQDAVTRPMNPHSYHLKRRTPSPRMFELIVLHIREFGFQEIFGGTEYTYYEAAGYKLWTMMNPVEWTILVNRKELPDVRKSENQNPAGEQPALDETLPELYTGRYMAHDVLSSGLVIPVRISMYPPEPLLGKLPYPVEHEVRALMPERPMHAEWPKFSPLFWKKLEHIGIEKIARELRAISEQHDGKALALLCFEDLLKGQRCHRVVLSAWWHEMTGWKMLELTDEGEVLELHQLHRQVMPLRPK